MDKIAYFKCSVSLTRSAKVLFIFVLILLVMKSNVCSARNVKKSPRDKKFRLASLTDGTQTQSRRTHIHGKAKEIELSRSLKRSSGTAKQGKRNRDQELGDAILRKPELSGFLKSFKRAGSINGLVSRNDFTRNQGTVRRRRLFCNSGIGYHLIITRKGKVRTKHAKTNTEIMEVFSVDNAVVGIRSAKFKRFLCIRRNGKVFTRICQCSLFFCPRENLTKMVCQGKPLRWVAPAHIQMTFRPDCQFREALEANMYSTYASEIYSDHQKREGYFLSINQDGNLPKTTKKVTYRQRRAHWIPIS